MERSLVHLGVSTISGPCPGEIGKFQDSSGTIVSFLVYTGVTDDFSIERDQVHVENGKCYTSVD